MAPEKSEEHQFICHFSPGRINLFDGASEDVRRERERQWDSFSVEPGMFVHFVAIHPVVVQVFQSLWRL